MYLCKSAKQFYSKKVCFIGTESSGKSTISSMIANKCQTSYIPEYGRKFVKDFYNGDEKKLTVFDFLRIASRQYESILENQSELQIKILDTDLRTTQFYFKLYFGYESEEINILIRRLDEYCPIDAYIYLSDEVKWVDDGLRLNGTPEQRQKTKEMLSSAYKDIPLLYVNGNKYTERFDIAEKNVLDIIKKLNSEDRANRKKNQRTKAIRKQIYNDRIMSLGRS